MRSTRTDRTPRTLRTPRRSRILKLRGGVFCFCYTDLKDEICSRVESLFERMLIHESLDWLQIQKVFLASRGGYDLFVEHCLG
jgi:hypothetical protein